MQPDRPSSTAELVCSWRALEHLLPAEERIVDDPYARAFLGPGRGSVLDVAEKLPTRALRALSRRLDRVLRGAMTFVLARHRAMDELLVAQRSLETAARPQQVVLLGAGYDSRSVRLAEALGEAPFYEVDHPATARRKQSLAPGVFGDAPRAKSVPVAVDFERESIADKLRDAGFAEGAPTFWFWEGVSMYLDDDAVRSTFDLVRGLSAPGSLLTFDVLSPPETGLLKITRRDLPNLAMRLIYSEPFTWMPPADEEGLEAMLREHGLALIERTGAEALVGRYAKPRGSKNHMSLCVAEVDRDV